MKLNFLQQRILSFTIVFIISSCSSPKLNTAANVDSNTFTPTTIPVLDECISSFEDFAYTAGDGFDLNMPDPILPLSPWEIELEFPEDDFIYRVFNFREINGDTEIWIRRIKPIVPVPGNVGRDFVVYSPNTGEQTLIPAEIGQTGVYVNKLFVNSKGELWGNNMWSPSGGYSLKSVPILSKYNEENQRFEFDINSFEVPLIQDDINFNDWADIFLDDNDVFWIFIQFDGLYTYLPEKGEIEKKVNIPEFEVWKPFLAPNGNFYYRMLDNNPEEGIKIFQYSTQADEIIVYTILKDSWPKDGDIFMDSSNRLWFGAAGFLAEDGTWNLLQTNVDKYFENRKGQYFYLWDTPNIIMESSNGIIWFEKFREIDNGMAWYDPQTGVGCMFTNLITLQPNLLEDDFHTMWMVVYGKLYKYSLDR